MFPSRAEINWCPSAYANTKIWNQNSHHCLCISTEPLIAVRTDRPTDFHYHRWSVQLGLFLCPINRNSRFGCCIEWQTRLLVCGTELLLRRMSFFRPCPRGIQCTIDNPDCVVHYQCRLDRWANCAWLRVCARCDHVMMMNHKSGEKTRVRVAVIERAHVCLLPPSAPFNRAKKKMDFTNAAHKALWVFHIVRSRLNTEPGPLTVKAPTEGPISRTAESGRIIRMPEEKVLQVRAHH